MNVIQHSDDGGDTLTVLDKNGFLFPKFPDTRGVEGLNSVTIRDDDILLYTYPKSGTHWIYEIAREILAGVIFDDDHSKGSTFMEMVPEESYADLPSPRILNTHALLEQLPPDVITKKIKIINTIRNPKDTAVSVYNFVRSLPYVEYQGKWENFLRPWVHGKFPYGSWFDTMKYWETVKKKHPDLPLFTVFYEDLKQDQMAVMRKLCQFLGVERSDEFLERVCLNTGFDKMKSQKPVAKTGLFRKGEVGDWKNWFTVAQNEWFDQFYQEKMKDFPLEMKFTLDRSTST